MHIIDLNGMWSLSPHDPHAIAPHCPYFLDNPSVDCVLPGDIHTALLEKGLIPDPFVGTNELEIQWVGRHDWILERTFTLTEEDLDSGTPFITFTMADTMITLFINDRQVGMMYNQFRRWRFEIGEYLQVGENTVRLLFESAEGAAVKVHEQLPYPIPYSEYPVHAKHRNLIRKTQCHSGWDWGPCIMTFGIYEPVKIEFVDEGFIDSVKFTTVETGASSFDVTVEVEYAPLDGVEALDFTATIAGAAKTITHAFGPGRSNTASLTFSVSDIRRWRPNGEGKAVLYPLTVTAGSQTSTRLVGFRTLEVETIEDGEGGKSMTFVVNGERIFAKGANWIPIDSFPSRMTGERYEHLLQSMVDANMNMVRLWGGGMYEHKIFYDLCDEKGILIWHDMMFSCAMYPATESFLANVEEEIRYQVNRLQAHPSIALWCGNNEDLGAITWYEESRANMTRYIVDYDRLNEGVVGKTIKAADPSRRWWPSSPSSGEGEYTDNWSHDKRGDMHIWSVWHDGSPFERYYTYTPRFVSEFGFQSFPALSTVNRYADEAMHNLTSSVMEHHQKNPRGNSIIIENFTRYYRLPTSFEQLLYLSQVQQARAMKIAIEYWRTLHGRTMGTLYWQLNDIWPVASWSSIDYYGKWKLLHYAARRFYNPILPIIYMKEDGLVEVHVVNDSAKSIADEAKLSVKYSTYEGNKLGKSEYPVVIRPRSSIHVTTIDLSRKSKIDRSNTFIYVKLKSDELYMENTLLLEKPKASKLRNPEIKISVANAPGGFSVTVSCRYPAFEVALDSGTIAGIFSDNLFDIRPTAQKVIFFKSAKKVSLEAFKAELKVFDLYSSSR